VNGKARLTVGHILQRYIGRPVFLIVHDRVTVGERPTPHILPGDADRMTLVEQRGVGQRFGKAPVEPHATRLHFTPVFVDFGDLTLNIDTVRYFTHLRRQLLQAFHVEGGVGIAGPLMAQVGSPVDEQRLVGFLNQRVGHVIACHEIIAVGFHHGFGVVFGQHALLDQALRIQRA